MALCIISINIKLRCGVCSGLVWCDPPHPPAHIISRSTSSRCVKIWLVVGWTGGCDDHSFSWVFIPSTVAAAALALRNPTQPTQSQCGLSITRAALTSHSSYFILMVLFCIMSLGSVRRWWWQCLTASSVSLFGRLMLPLPISSSPTHHYIFQCEIEI